MKGLSTVLTVIGIVLMLAFAGCGGTSESGEHSSGSEQGENGERSGERSSRSESEEDTAGSGERSSKSESEEDTEESGEHSSGSEQGEGGERSGEHGSGSESEEGGEESGVQFGPNEVFNQIRAGARLVLSYDGTANAFTGTVQNITDVTLTRVRVEVHLSNGIELGPTTPVDLGPSQIAEIVLPASAEPFASWSAHPEVG